MQERYLHRREANDYFRVVVGYFGLALVIAGGALFVDQKESPDKYRPFLLPANAPELERIDPHTRSFAIEASEKNQTQCGELNVGYMGTTYTHFMPVKKTTEGIEEGAILIAPGSQSNHATVDTIVNCSYPASDPAYIQEIPVERR